ncbi:MAG: hypothetical protein HY731_06825 [Candidatus Tectomicrobia bacterium]|nr:hypothetical protein [Candidatus Tectomicrobia bacterium]
MYRINDLERVHIYSDPNNFNAEVSIANRWRYLKNGRIDFAFGESEIEGVFLTRSTDNLYNAEGRQYIEAAIYRVERV